MKRNRSIYTLILTLAMSFVMVMGMTLSVSAESDVVTGSCYFDGSNIVCDFDSNVVAETVKGLEPGDDVTFTVEYTNEYKGKTHWYMRNETIETLEQSYDKAENGGYTYTLTNVAPDGSREVLFDNSTVGGEYTLGSHKAKTSRGTDNTGEGLHQATNASDDWFFVQTLKKGQSGRTELYVKFDGETEVNNYMDTNGSLLLAYAVEKDTGRIKTGDETNVLKYIAVMLAAFLMLILTILSYRKDRKVASAEAGAYGEGMTEQLGKVRNQRKERD
ncbi:MAG: hypothetical protein IKG44_03700 [Mogibacterium sp.]|nr:hypothetical protein [Mogibacterium sp.]